jgi:hypothetical protein
MLAPPRDEAARRRRPAKPDRAINPATTDAAPAPPPSPTADRAQPPDCPLCALFAAGSTHWFELLQIAGETQSTTL